MNESEEAAVRARVRAARSRARAGGRGTVVLSEPVSLDEDFDPPVIVKTADEAAEISAAISGNIIFAGLDTDQRSVLIGAMERREFSAGETIIRQGDAGDYFYVQVSGTCQVLVNGAVVLETSAGQSFGELALLYDSPRAATVVVAGSDPVVTWAIDRRTFKHAVVATAIAKRRRFGAAVDRVPLLQGLPPNERGAILDCLLPVEAAPGAVLVAEGDTDADRFYIVDDGELMAHKTSLGSAPDLGGLRAQAGAGDGASPEPDVAVMEAATAEEEDEDEGEGSRGEADGEEVYSADELHSL
ncbi:hypothetical protein FNF31_07162 [Cafeteria roenbergensis]|uniref:Cyclic nucleotide-binding domain-containing protein n=1 Tax=Cafeteria roenbergensis TaxID=33653 RepID=A0A5A8CA46_CAFRO|nr:hypothetical protein FNF31_07162 [Cafeteria roenbergensis]